MLEYHNIKPGDIIVSTPYIKKGIIFDKSVILIMSHDKKGSSGIIINKLLNNLKGSEISRSLIFSKNKTETQIIADDNITIPVYFGGPVEQEKGIIIYSSDYKTNSSIEIAPQVLVSTSSKIINDIATKNGPIYKNLILGYADWHEGQLMDEIKQNDWLLLLQKDNSNSAFKLLFLEDYLYRWESALKLAGVNTANYVNNLGNA